MDRQRGANQYAPHAPWLMILAYVFGSFRVGWKKTLMGQEVSFHFGLQYDSHLTQVHVSISQSSRPYGSGGGSSRRPSMTMVSELDFFLFALNLFRGNFE